MLVVPWEGEGGIKCPGVPYLISQWLMHSTTSMFRLIITTILAMFFYDSNEGLGIICKVGISLFVMLIARHEM